MNQPDLKGETVPEASQVVEHLFRYEAGKMVATLTKIFGLVHLTLAEDVVQEALARALQTWPFYGVPQNPAAWIMRASRNLALDAVRREKLFRDKEPEIIATLEQWPISGDVGSAPLLENEIQDDRLRMMFVCCHPLISQEDQVALALKTLCSFSSGEIAKAFLTTEAAIAKRLTRAKQKIREARIAFEIPEGEELSRRLDGVLQSLYLLFNEGYKASSGEKLVREDVCHEAIRLASLLAEHPAGNQPRTHALLALMLLNASRIPSRMDGEGNLQLLQEQDRTQWNQAMIARGMFHITQSAAGNKITEYHLQAGIAARHCAAKDYAATGWRQILELYDRLLEFDDSPVVALNRAVALAEVHGPQAGIEAVRAIRNRQSLESYYLLYAVLGEFEWRLNHSAAAAAHFRQAMQLAEINSEQAFLAKRLRACEGQADNMTATTVRVLKRNMHSARPKPPTFLLLFLANFCFLNAGITWTDAADAPETTSSLYKSTDHGASWVKAGEGLPSQVRINALTKARDGVVAGTDQGVFTSRDAGEHWQPAKKGIGTGSRVLCLTTDAGRVFAGTHQHGMLFSDDAGLTWSAVNAGLTDRYVRSLLVVGTKLYAGTDKEGVFVSENNGTLWTNQRTGLPDSSQVFDLVSVGGTVFAGLYNKGLYRWDAERGLWMKTDEIAPLELAVAGKTLVVGHNPGGVFVSEDQGKTWQDGNAGLPVNAPIWILAADEERVWAGTTGRVGLDQDVIGLFASQDHGRSWARSDAGLPPSSAAVSFVVAKQFILVGISTRKLEAAPTSR